MEAPIAPCRGCGTPKRVDTECAASAECIARQLGWHEERDRFIRQDIFQELKRASDEFEALPLHARPLVTASRQSVAVSANRHGTDLTLTCNQCGTSWPYSADGPTQCPDCLDHMGEPVKPPEPPEPHYDCADCKGVCSLSCRHDCFGAVAGA